MSAARTRTRSRSRSGSGASNPPAFGRSRKRDKKDDLDISDEEIREHVPKGLARAHVESKLNEKRLREHGLTPPSDFEGEEPELPEDIAKTDHEQLSNLMLRFQSAHATATWQSSMAYIEADIMEEIADYLENRALLSSDQSNDTKRKAEARTDDNVVFFRAKRKVAYHDHVRFRDHAKMLDGKIKVLSRVGGFKDDDDEASDRNARSKNSLGATRKRSRRSRD